MRRLLHLIILWTILLLVCAITLGLLNDQEQKRWREFAEKNNCVALPDDTAPFSVTPGQAGYRCADGKTYWRAR